MMQARIAAVMVASMLVVTACPALAQQEPARVESPEAGLALSFPADWSVHMKMERDDSKLPDGVTASESVRAWVVLSAVSGWDLVVCTLTWFEGLPVSAAAHADIIAEDLSSDPAATVETTSVELPAGDAFRVQYTTPDGNAVADDFLLGMGPDQYHLRCLDSSPFEDDFLAIAESIEFTSADYVPSYDPFADATSIEMVFDFATVVEVADGLLMSADCASGMWAEFEDGSFREAIACELSDRPIDDPELQGSRPTETVQAAGGTCEWVSDFWLATDGSEVWATSWELTVTPDGAASGSSTYGAESLDCSGE